MKLFDISQELFSSKVFPGDVPPSFQRVLSLPKDNCNLTTLAMCVHNGTHMDSPRHFIEDGKTVEELPLSLFYGECLVAEFQGLIRKEDIMPVLAVGVTRLLLKGECEISEEAAIAITESQVRLIGVESQSVGNAQAPRAVHMILLGKEVIPLEGLRLGQVPVGKYQLSAFPINLAGSDGSPVRAVLLAEEQKDTITQQNLEEFVHALASKAPVPGGGGTAALMGALGTALGHMVGSLTIGKKKYAAVWEDIQALQEKASKLEQELLELIRKDGEVFEPLSRAYGLPKTTSEEIAHKEEVMEAALREACSVPMEIMEKVCQSILCLQEYAAKGSVIAISDAGCGAVCAKAALQAADLNVRINTKSMKDREYGEALNRKAQNMLTIYSDLADQIYAQVADQLNSR